MSNGEIIILAAFIKEKPAPLAYESSHPMSERNQYTHTPKLTFFVFYHDNKRNLFDIR